MNSKIIELKNVKKSYGKDLVLDIKDFSFIRGKKYLLVGENGSGKSTLLKIILELIKVDSGLILKDYNSISYVPEKSILPDFISLKTFLNKYELKEINEFSVKFELNINKPFYKYSKGMRQKAIIIQALIKKSEIIIFDEPINGLDIKSKQYFINHLMNVDSTIIISTHYFEQFEGFDFEKINIINRDLVLG